MTQTIDQLIDELLPREGGYVDHPADRGGPTCFGITQATARANGYVGPMSQLPRATAAAIYEHIYWTSPGYAFVAQRSERVAAEMFDTGVNMGPAVASGLLQRVLNALNRGGTDYADVVADGRLGPASLKALDGFMRVRGKAGEEVLLKALDALQGERYVALAERNPSQEVFLYGWLRARLGQAA